MDNYIINRIKNWNFTAEQIFSPNPFLITVSVLFSVKSEFISFPIFCLVLLYFIHYLLCTFKQSFCFIFYPLFFAMFTAYFYIFNAIDFLSNSAVAFIICFLNCFFPNFRFLKERMNFIYSCFVAFLQVH